PVAAAACGRCEPVSASLRVVRSAGSPCTGAGKSACSDRGSIQRVAVPLLAGSGAWDAWGSPGGDRSSQTPGTHTREWAASSAGRAPRSQRGGREFEPPAVHQPSLARLARELRLSTPCHLPSLQAPPHSASDCERQLAKASTSLLHHFHRRRSHDRLCAPVHDRAQLVLARRKRGG